MILEHVAIYTSRLEVLRAFYEQYFGGVAGPKYVNPHTRFESYFLRFDTGARLELRRGCTGPDHAGRWHPHPARPPANRRRVL